MKDNLEINDIVVGSEIWDKSIRRTSRLMGLIALLLMLSVPLGMTIIYGENVDFQKTLVVTASIMSVFAPVAIAENLSLYPIMGIGGLILSVVTGNVANMKVPAATSGMNIAEAKVGSPEAEVVSILSVGASSIVTMLILIIGVIFGGYLMPYLDNPVLAPGFNVVLPAMVGGMVMPSLMKNPKESVAPFVFTLIVYLIMGPAFFSSKQGFIILAAMGVSLLAVRFMLKKGIMKTK